jgi:hypothetical protein
MEIAVTQKYEESHKLRGSRYSGAFENHRLETMAEFMHDIGSLGELEVEG